MKDLYRNPAVQKALNDVFEDGGWWRYKDKRADLLESNFAQHHQANYGVSVSNGTIALDIILKCIGLKKGDEIILPAYDFYSLPKSVSNFGAKPVFVDVNPHNYTIDTSLIEEKISPATKAIIGVHIDGSVAELDRLAQLAKKHKILFIEDCAQAHGAIYMDKKVGSYGDFAVFSFGGIKLITAGQGGMILCRSKENYERCYAIANRGLLPDKSVNPYGLIGENFQLSELQCAVAQVQLDQLEELGRQRERAMNYLDAEIAQIPYLKPFKQFEKTQRRAQMRYSFKADPQLRDDLYQHLESKGLPILKGYNSIKKEERLQGTYEKGEEFPIAAQAQKSILSVFHPFLLGDDEDLDKLVTHLRDFKK